MAVLGLCTGSTPLDVYSELIRLHEAGFSFENVITFNLDEYYPMSRQSNQSYHRYMRENLFDHIDIPDDQVFIPLGDLAPEEIDEHCSCTRSEFKPWAGSEFSS